MLNEKKGERELCYLVKVDAIEPILGRDRVESATVGGWHIMCRKSQFQPGDIGVYFEIDSKTPETEPFMFLAPKHFKVKTQKYRNSDGSHFYSQGLLMSPADFGWTVRDNEVLDDCACVIGRVDDETRFLTQRLGITYAVAEDNSRKANSTDDKYKKMAQRHPKLFQNPIIKRIYKTNIGKKILFVFFGKKRDGLKWPSHIAARTDVERIQNMIYVLNDKRPFVATEKIDGSSCSIMAERDRFGRIKQYVCSRNVVFQAEDQKCFYDTNIYFEIYNKYGIKEKIERMLNDLNLPNIAIQLEVYGPSVQKRDYSATERAGAVFHIVSNGVKFPMDKVVELCEKYDLPHVPIVNDYYILPNTIEELQAYVESEGSRIDGLPREGIVFYDKETGQQYFKFVSPDFLMTYHN